MAASSSTFTLAQLPAFHALNHSPTPLEQWDSDELIRTYLKTCQDPKMEPDRELMRARLQMFRVRMFELQHLRTCIRPAVSYEFDRELAAIMYKRKLLLWMSFPIRDLPSEILTTIFRYVVWSSSGADQATQHRLRLTWVCKRFREVALADQTLWNSVWFRDSPPWRRSLAFIERAGTAPLDIRINEKERPEDAPNQTNPHHPIITVPQINTILDVLLPRIRQIRILVVVLEDMDVVETFMRRFATAGPPEILERFEMHRTGAPYLWPQEKSTGQGGHWPLSEHLTPKLRWLSLNGLTIDWNRLPPTNLRTIDLRRMSFQACPTSERWTELLKASPDLYKLSLDAAGPQWTPRRIHDIPAVRLPHLRDLIIGDMSCLFALHILAHMEAPRVMSLSLMQLTGQDYGPLMEMLTGRFPEVRLLHIQGMELNKTDVNVRRVVRWFESMPRLKLFKFSQTKPYILEALVADPRDYRTDDEREVYTPSSSDSGQEAEDARPIICPELDTLYFHSQGEGDMAALTKGRKELGVPFKRVYMPNTNIMHIGQEEVKTIRENVGQFLVIYHMLVTEEEDVIHEEMANSLGLAVRWRRYKR
ncbi:hypothetical protein PYCCODRAFT_256026 [Trametes coccinea BRFM310]|uniref:F-box domain-containing protein n=1 Tax=Trametes coccinea (strain BRFM310) TaxID=1353009 RepID=A0A1Y2ISU3_TRAC3|nr:hypothetical protein PYCCODRAFT_256026 [Trametes coccinea BRFM310]